jgi:hypothetical protein
LKQSGFSFRVEQYVDRVEKNNGRTEELDLETARRAKRREERRQESICFCLMTTEKSWM